MHCTLQVFCVCVLLNLVHAAIGPRADIVISNKNISPDGYERVATLAGTTKETAVFPAPIITARKGDRFQINVVNKLSDPNLLTSTSIHWHGVHHITGTNWADGAAFVTQCPILPDESFLYEFTVASQAGTFWYHSHISTQYCDGLRGPLIVYDPDDPYANLYDVDDESTIMTLSDWFHQTYKGGIPPKHDSVLINGKGRYPGGPPVPLAIVDVKRNLRYRLRIISMACEPSFNFAIDNHKMTIIEADGEYTKPLVVDNFQIHSGQRYSVIVKADQPVDNYWIRANPDERGRPGFDGNRNLAILRYKGAADADPVTTSTTNRPLNEANLRALQDASVPGEPKPEGGDVNLNFVTGIDLKLLRFTLNGVSFLPPSVPVLLQILSGAQSAQDLLPHGSVYSLPRNKTIEITLPGTNPATGGGPHAFHLHGHTFSVVRSAGSSTYNYENPVRRDVVNIGNVGDNVTIRFRTDNLGPWFLHCHMNFHFDAGLAVVFAEGEFDEVKSHITPPKYWTDLCPGYTRSPVSR